MFRFLVLGLYRPYFRSGLTHVFISFYTLGKVFVAKSTLIFPCLLFQVCNYLDPVYIVYPDSLTPLSSNICVPHGQTYDEEKEEEDDELYAPCCVDVYVS